MGVLKTVIGALLLVVTIALGALFALQNPQPVPLDLLFVQLPPRTLSLWLLLALAVGALLGLVAAAGLLLELRTRLAALRRERNRLATEVDRLRRVGITEGE